MPADSVGERLREESREGRIPCAAALRIARELGVPPAKIGEIANGLGIRIADCQLGCF
ncbi:MAG: hypothetical protein PHN82_00800 [bacterium]|nr:hypothetical protein [bacterium]